MPVKIKCNACGTIFEPIPFNFLKQKNCPNCALFAYRLITEEFIQNAKVVHGNNYDYSETNYVNAKTKVKIKCNQCRETFLQLPRGHIYEKSGCPKCRMSHGEEKIALLLRVLNIPFHTEYKFQDCIGKSGVPLRFDFYLPQKNLCIEFDGKQHYDQKSKYWSPSIAENDATKTSFCKTKGITLKRISHTELEKVEEKIKEILLLPTLMPLNG